MGTQEFKTGMKVRVVAAGDESDGKVGFFHQYLEDDGDGMTIGVLFKGDPHIYAFSPGEIQPKIPPPSSDQPDPLLRPNYADREVITTDGSDWSERMLTD